MTYVQLNIQITSLIEATHRLEIQEQSQFEVLLFPKKTTPPVKSNPSIPGHSSLQADSGNVSSSGRPVHRSITLVWLFKGVLNHLDGLTHRSQRCIGQFEGTVCAATEAYAEGVGSVFVPFCVEWCGWEFWR